MGAAGSSPVAKVDVAAKGNKTSCCISIRGNGNIQEFSSETHSDDSLDEMAALKSIMELPSYKRLSNSLFIFITQNSAKTVTKKDIQNLIRYVIEAYNNEISSTKEKKFDKLKSKILKESPQARKITGEWFRMVSFNIKSTNHTNALGSFFVEASNSFFDSQ